MSEEVDVVIVAYGSDDVIVPAVIRAKKLGGRVVVVDHGDGCSAQLAAAVDATSFHDPENPGFGAGQNRGVAQTRSRFVLLCNPDAEIDVTAIDAGTDFLDQHAQVAAVQGVIVNRATGAPERSQGRALGPVHLVGRSLGARSLLAVPAVRRLARRSATLRDHADRVPAGAVDVEAIAATALLVRRSAFDDVGGFDRRYFLYGEDLDLCHRLRQAGWTLVALPEPWAVHIGGGSAESSWAREMEWWRGTMTFASRWWTPISWGIAVVAAFVQWLRLSLRRPLHAQRAFKALLLAPLWQRRALSAKVLSHPSSTEQQVEGGAARTP